MYVCSSFQVFAHIIYHRFLSVFLRKQIFFQHIKVKSIKNIYAKKLCHFTENKKYSSFAVDALVLKPHLKFISWEFVLLVDSTVVAAARVTASVLLLQVASMLLESFNLGFFVCVWINLGAKKYIFSLNRHIFCLTQKQT